MERTAQTVFLHKGIMYVPKFGAVDQYVGPGYGTSHNRVYSAAQLKFLGAQEGLHQLAPAMAVKGKK